MIFVLLAGVIVIGRVVTGIAHTVKVEVRLAAHMNCSGNINPRVRSWRVRNSGTVVADIAHTVTINI